MTTEQAERRLPVQLCLEEIDRCRPFFIGILGERYGFVPDHLPAEAIERYPWLAFDPERSITELEILHGALRKPEGRQTVFFYLRDLNYSLYTANPDLRSDCESESVSARERIADLRHRIAVSGHCVRHYTEPPALQALLLADLLTMIAQLHPEERPQSWLEQEAEVNDAFVESRRQIYVGHHAEFRKLERHVHSRCAPLVIVCETGSGKSALPPNWLAWRQHDASPSMILSRQGLTECLTDWSFRLKSHLYSAPESAIIHFVGAAQEEGWQQVVRRLVLELQKQAGLSRPVPGDPFSLASTLAQALAENARRRRLLLLLDGVDQLQGIDPDHSLIWLPERFAAAVRVVSRFLWPWPI